MIENSPDRVNISLVATDVPPGMIVHTEFGVSKDKLGLEQSQGPGAPEGLRAVPASQVGLEWRENGVKIEPSDRWAQECFVLVSSVPQAFVQQTASENPIKEP